MYQQNENVRRKHVAFSSKQKKNQVKQADLQSRYKSFDLVYYNVKHLFNKHKTNVINISKLKVAIQTPKRERNGI